jgi:hypothetical protein
MTVQELIVALKMTDQKAEVIMSKDGEGNGFSPLSSFSKDRYTPDPKMPWSVEPDRSGSRKCLIFWPTN